MTKPKAGARAVDGDAIHERVEDKEEAGLFLVLAPQNDCHTPRMRGVQYAAASRITH
jgi:hypothetical protein